MRNMLLALLLSQGTPMIVMGDELAKSHGGNNNWYGHDTPMAHLQWNDSRPEVAGLLRFASELIHFRRACPLLGRAEFLGPSDITWHDSNWGDAESRFLALTLHAPAGGGGSLYAAFNAHGHLVDAGLPSPPAGHRWCRVVDTNLPSPKDFTPGGNAGVEARYGVQAFSAIMLIAKAV